jgi:hypothetical protein
MVDTSASVPVVTLPRLTAGAAVAGQVDISRQLFEFSRPSLDQVIVDDLSRAHAAAVDVEILNGNALSGRTRDLLNWSGILSVAATITNAQTFLNSLCQAYSQLAGASGFGASDTSGYVTILHPRRAAWLAAGVSGVLPPARAGTRPACRLRRWRHRWWRRHERGRRARRRAKPGAAALARPRDPRPRRRS